MTEKSSYSQNFVNSPVSGQVAQGSNINQSQNTTDTPLTKQPSAEDVSELLNALENIIKELNLPKLQETKAIGYLNCVKVEVEDQSPDRETATGNLKKVVETIKTFENASESVESLLEKIKPLVAPIAAWLGVAVNFLIG